MKKIILLGAVLALLFAACKQDSNSTSNTGQTTGTFASPMLLAGHWVAIDFCSRANQYGSVLDAMNNAHLPFAFSISFDPNKPDSVTCHNGYKAMTLPVQFKDDTLELVGANKGKSIFLVYNSQGDKDMNMFNGTDGPTKMDRFIKSGANARDGYTAFATALNHNLFEGVFSSGGKDNIQFSPGGFILNWGPYDRYSVCAGGNCFVGGSAIDIITLSKAREENSEKIFGFRFDGDNTTLTLYRMVQESPGENSVYSVKEPVYTFVRKPVGGQ